MVVRAPRSMLTTSSMVQAIIVGTFSIHAAIDLPQGDREKGELWGPGD